MKKAAYKIMIENAIINNYLIRPIEKVGSGRYSQYSADHTNEYCKYLNELGVSYEIGNDSPKGGMLGKYIKIKKEKNNE